MPAVAIYKVSVAGDNHSYVQWTECEGMIPPKQLIDSRLRSITFEAQGTGITPGVDCSVSKSSAATIEIIGTANPDCSGVGNTLTPVSTTTSTTTLAPINFTITATCSSPNISGIITVSSFSGGNGTYSTVAIGNTNGTSYNASTTNLSGATSYQWTGLTNGNWFVTLRDSVGNHAVKSATVACGVCSFGGGSVSYYGPASTTTTSTTTTTAAPTTTTTTAAPTTTTAAPTTTTAAPTTTTAAPTTTTAAPTTTTAAPTTTTAAPTTTTAAPTTTTAAPTTTTAAPTTTTAAPACNEWNLYTNGNSGDAGCFDYIDCTGTPQNACVDNSASVTICAIGTPSQSSGTGVNASNVGPCATTTTTTAAPTTTTAAPSFTTYNIGQDYANATAACTSFAMDFHTEVYAAESLPGTVTRFYTDTALTVGFVGSSDFYAWALAPESITAFVNGQVSPGGYVSNITGCSGI